ncbi:hypothetical protein Vau01_064910 [Virgisporangium aurantiacum]|uniref:Uncharacterized protein n=1 Tax=Virgisporangium aurantiacum TaxID=175570 RepID=A0A8J4E1N4_9ACTN|nr:hypothetical protein Vau01_064910 [Virgisporangium aurantiacum]
MPSASTNGACTGGPPTVTPANGKVGRADPASSRSARLNHTGSPADVVSNRPADTASTTASGIEPDKAPTTPPIDALDRTQSVSTDAAPQ